MKKIFIFIILIYALALFAAFDAETRFNQGIDALKSGNYGSAELLFRKIVDDSDDEEFQEKAHFFLAKSIFLQKKYKSAIFEFNTYLNNCKIPSLCNETYFWIGKTFFLKKDYIHSIEKLNRYIQISKNGKYVATAHDIKAEIYYNSKRYDEAVLEWEKSIKISNDKKYNANRVLMIGFAFFYNKNYDKAMKRLAPLLTSDVNQEILAKTRLILGKIYQIKKNDKTALLFFKAIPAKLIKTKFFENIQYFKAISFLRLKDFNSAKTFLQIFILTSKNSDFYDYGQFELGKLLIKLKKEKKGMRLLESVLKGSLKKKLRIKSAKILCKIYIKNQPEKVIELLSHFTFTDTTEYEGEKELLLLFAKANIKERKFFEAKKNLKLFEKKFEFDKNNEEVYFLRARLALLEGDVKTGLKIFKKIKEENPFSNYIHETNYYLGIVSFKQKKYKLSIKHLLEYISLKNPDNYFDAVYTLFYANMAIENKKATLKFLNILYKKFKKRKDIDKAIYDYSIFIGTKNRYFKFYQNILIKQFSESKYTMKIYFSLGEKFFNKKKYSTSIIFFNKYLNGTFSKNKGDAFFYTIRAFYNLKKYDDVIKKIKKEKMPPMSEDYWEKIPLILARSYFYKNNFIETYRLLKSEKYDGYSKSDILILLKSAVAIGDINTAKGLIQYLQNSKFYYAEALYAIGKYFFNKESFDESLGYFSRILIECPKTSAVTPAKLEIAKIYIEKERFKDAISRLKEIDNKKFLSSKISMLIKLYFQLGKYKQALSLTQKNLYTLLKTTSGEDIIKLNIEYFFTKRNRYQFFKYTKYLKNYKGNYFYLNNKIALFYFNTAIFSKAYYYFYKNSSVKNKYQRLSYFYLGKISYHIYRKRSNAINFYLKLLNLKEVSKKIYYKTIINLAILYFEQNNKKLCKKHLKDIINSPRNGTFHEQAENLYEFYGFQKSSGVK